MAQRKGHNSLLSTIIFFDMIRPILLYCPVGHNSLSSTIIFLIGATYAVAYSPLAISVQVYPVHFCSERAQATAQGNAL